MGAAWVTTDPTAESPSWTATGPQQSGKSVTGVSCASSSLCVLADAEGEVSTSSNPASASPTWTPASRSRPRRTTGLPFLRGAERLRWRSTLLATPLIHAQADASSPSWDLTRVDATSRVSAISCLCSHAVRELIHTAGRRSPRIRPTRHPAWTAATIDPGQTADRSLVSLDFILCCARKGAAGTSIGLRSHESESDMDHG